MNHLPQLGPGFDHTPPRDGYAWWYLDALSEDGEHGLTIIVFLGSVFSPYYAIARRQGPADPMNHCCINVALYGRPARFAMTDRPERAITRDTTSITNSLMRVSSALWKRMYSPTFCSRLISSGLRKRGMKGPNTAPRGPAISSWAAAFCAAFIDAIGSAGMRSGPGMQFCKSGLITMISLSIR